jgi:2,3-bisphosphoglycerate-independent phosphoglycerate mutase
MSKKKLVMLTVLDGFGLRENQKGNAVTAARKPNIDYLFNTYPHTTLGASGEDVGLPEGQMGNSEVGHLNIGAGRVVYQSLTRVNLAVKDQSLDKMPAINAAIEHAIARESKLHIFGLLSDGGVHSHIDHIIYLIDKAVERGVKKVCVHAFLDGRDVPPKSAEVYFDQLMETVNKYDNVYVGVVSGRYYAMDRDRNYNRTQLAYDALVYNQGPVKELYQGLKESYDQDVTDEFVVPYIVNLGTNIEDRDAIINANFRPDRQIQISLGITNPSETTLKNTKEFEDIVYVCMMLYSEKVKGLVNFDIQTLDDMYGSVIADAGLTQLRIAETEKYAHVTYFFDGGVEKDLEGATRILVPSPKVATYDMQPEMSAYEVTDKVVEAILSEKFDTIILNYANCDMVGHTTDFNASVKAVETVDQCLGRVYDAVKKVDGTLIVVADHGNAEQLVDEDGSPFSAHTTNPVPFIITRKDVLLRERGNLGDITPTMLELLGVPQPKAMTGKSMIKGYLK